MSSTIGSYDEVQPEDRLGIPGLSRHKPYPCRVRTAPSWPHATMEWDGGTWECLSPNLGPTRARIGIYWHQHTGEDKGAADHARDRSSLDESSSTLLKNGKVQLERADWSAISLLTGGLEDLVFRGLSCSPMTMGWLRHSHTVSVIFSMCPFNWH